MFLKLHVLGFSLLLSKPKNVTFNYRWFLCAGPRDMKCFSPLGMESGRIPDLAIVASSRDSQYRGPERGRLNLKQNGNEMSARNILVIF